MWVVILLKVVAILWAIWILVILNFDIGETEGSVSQLNLLDRSGLHSSQSTQTGQCTGTIQVSVCLRNLVVIGCHLTPGWSVWNYTNLFHPAMWDVHVRKRWDNHCHTFRFMLFLSIASAPSALMRFGDAESLGEFFWGVAWEVQRQRSHSVQKSLRGARYFGNKIHGSWYF